MITGVQPKILVNIDENGEMHVDPTQAELMGLVESKYNWKLVREHDGLTKQSRDILWLEWNEEGRFKAKHDDIAVGRSLIMSPFNEMFTWQTTEVTAIIASTPNSDYIKFETRNSTYELFRLYDAPTGNPV
jgi:hypothetical protein